jgi:predicted DNA-binding protein (MmcQ/YjbR family)
VFPYNPYQFEPYASNSSSEEEEENANDKLIAGYYMVKQHWLIATPFSPIVLHEQFVPP